jgi:hypothetical protein
VYERPADSWNTAHQAARCTTCSRRTSCRSDLHRENFSSPAQFTIAVCSWPLSFTRAPSAGDATRDANAGSGPAEPGQQTTPDQLWHADGTIHSRGHTLANRLTSSLQCGLAQTMRVVQLAKASQDLQRPSAITLQSCTPPTTLAQWFEDALMQ